MLLALKLLQCFAIYVPLRQTAFHTVALPFSGWLFSLGIGISMFFAVELEKLVIRRSKASRR